MIDPKREAEAVVAGERTNTPVSGKVVDGNRAFARRGIAVCALIVFGAFSIWGGWGRAKTGNEDRATKPVVSLRTPYEAPRDPEPPARTQGPVQEAALMPVIRPPVGQPARSPGDELLDSARRPRARLQSAGAKLTTRSTGSEWARRIHDGRPALLLWAA